MFLKQRSVTLNLFVFLAVISMASTACKVKQPEISTGSDAQAKMLAAPLTNRDFVVTTNISTVLKEKTNSWGSNCYRIEKGAKLTIDRVDRYDYPTNNAKVRISNVEGEIVPCNASTSPTMTAVNVTSNDASKVEVPDDSPKSVDDIVAQIRSGFGEGFAEVSKIEQSVKNANAVEQPQAVTNSKSYYGFLYVGHLEGGKDQFLKQLYPNVNSLFGATVAAAAWALSGAYSKSTHACFRIFAKALERGGVINYNDPIWSKFPEGAIPAKSFQEWADKNPGPLLQKFGYRRVDPKVVNQDNAPIGTILVYHPDQQPCYSRSSGHIEIAVGGLGKAFRMACSDFCWVTNPYKYCPATGVYVPVGKVK